MDGDDVFELEGRIVSLRSDILTYGKGIMQYITVLYSNHFPEKQFDLKKSDNPFNVLKVLKQEVSEILLQSKLNEIFFRQNGKDIEECAKLVEVLTNISHLGEKLLECEKCINLCKLKAACILIGEMADILQSLPGTNTEIGSGVVCSILRREKKFLQSRLISKLKRLLNECVQYEYGRICVSKQLVGVLRSEDVIIDDPIELSHIWECIVSVSRLEDFVEDMLKCLWKFLIRPLWKEKKAQTPSISNASNRAEFIFENIAREQSVYLSQESLSQEGRTKETSSALGSCRMPLPSLLESLGQVFSFLWSEILCGNEVVAAAIGAKMGASGSSYSIVTVLMETTSSLLPKVETDIPAFKGSLEQPFKEFEEKLALFHFAAAAESSEGKSCPPTASLSWYLSDLGARYVEIRRREILERARELVLSDYHNTMIAAGDAMDDDLASAGDIGDSKALLDQSGTFAMQKLKFESCQISLAACRLLKLVHEVMKQACGSVSAKVANILFQSARDCLEIFLAVVPLRFAEVINTVPRMGAVYYNDCLYIAHNSTLLTHRYRHELGKLDEALLHSAGFVDFLPRFRSAGDQVMTSQLEEQRKTLAELVSRVNISPEGVLSPQQEEDGSGIRADGGSAGMNNNDDDDGEIRPGSLIQGGLKLAERISNNITNARKSQNIAESELVLNDEESAAVVVRHLERLSGQWLGVLQEPVYAKLTGYLLEGVVRDAIAPVMKADCISEAAASDISRLFRTIGRAKLLLPQESKDEEQLSRICPSWRKFCALTDLLEYSLSEVAEWLPRKKFASFTGNEMTALIKALFEDTPKRQGILTSILEMST